MIDDLLALDPVDVAYPLTDHPLNTGRALWLYGAPPLDGGRQWYDLCGLRHGTLTGGPAWATTPRGDAGLRVSGGSAVDVQNTPNLAAGDFTIAFWVRPDAAFGGRYTTLVEKGNGSGREIALWGDSGSQAVTLAAIGGGQSIDFFAPTLPVGEWRRLVWTRAGSANTLYRDGVSAQTFTLGTTTAVPGTLTFGRSLSGNTHPTVTYSDCAIWSRALSAAEVQADYDLSRRGYPGVLRRLRPSVSVLLAAGAASYTLTAGAGSFELAGQDAGLRAARRVAADAGAVTVSGQTAGLRVARRLASGAGAFALAGQDATLTKTGSYSLSAGVGAFALAGQDAATRAARRLPIDAGSLSLSGQAANLIGARRLAGGAGAVVLAGQSAALTYSGAATAGAAVTARVGLRPRVTGNVSVRARVAATAGLRPK